MEKSVWQDWLGTMGLLVALLATLLGCREAALPQEATRAMRIRLEVGAALDRLEHGIGTGGSIDQVILRLNMQLNREENALGEYFDTCKQIRDGLVELQSLRSKQRSEKFADLRKLVGQLPELEVEN